MRVAIRASLARTGEDLGLALRRALVDGLARRMRQRPDGDAAGGDLAEGRAGARSDGLGGRGSTGNEGEP